jgi:hypothetical protein
MNEKNYVEVREHAQKQANDLGMDVGLEKNSLFGTYRTFLLPSIQHRRGFELRCEVIHPMDISRTWNGHGYQGQGERAK